MTGAGTFFGLTLRDVFNLALAEMVGACAFGLLTVADVFGLAILEVVAAVGSGGSPPSISKILFQAGFSSASIAARVLRKVSLAVFLFSIVALHSPCGHSGVWKHGIGRLSHSQSISASSRLICLSSRSFLHLSCRCADVKPSSPTAVAAV